MADDAPPPNTDKITKLKTENSKLMEQIMKKDGEISSLKNEILLAITANEALIRAAVGEAKGKIGNDVSNAYKQGMADAKTFIKDLRQNGLL